VKIYQIIEKFFWVFLLAGIVAGLFFPVYNDFMMSLVKPMLMLMLFFVFLKTDALHIIEAIKDYKLMLYITCIYMLIMPVIFYFLVNLFDPRLAVAILLLTAMPAGVSSPTLTDIVKGNIPLSMSIVIITSLIAPFTVPLLFGVLKSNSLPVDLLALFRDLALIVFLPMLVSQIIKRYFPAAIIKQQHLFTSFNVILLFILVYAVMGSQSEMIITDIRKILWQVIFLYIVFILLHIAGYLMAFRQNKENKVTIAIGAAYMNNGMAIVLAATHFDPSVMILMVLSEIPWNTLLAPFRRIVKYL
jgi:predicted Na+-dependent transporter